MIDAAGRINRQQPLDTRWRINPRHWLAKDLLFAYTGAIAFLRGRPVHMSNVGEVHYKKVIGPHTNSATFLQPHFSRSANISTGATGGSTKFPYYETGGHSSILTLSWWWNVASNQGSTGLGSGGPSSGAFGAVAGILFGIPRASFYTSSGTSSTLGSGGTYLGSVWRHTVVIHGGLTSRAIYDNGGTKQSASSSFDIGSTHTQISMLGARHGAGYVLNGLSNSTKGTGLPLAISRVLSDAEVAKLYQEQLVNPWNLFTRSIWVPVGIPASGGTPTLSNLTAHTILSTSTKLRVDVTIP